MICSLTTWSLWALTVDMDVVKTGAATGKTTGYILKTDEEDSDMSGLLAPRGGTHFRLHLTYSRDMSIWLAYLHP